MPTVSAPVLANLELHDRTLPGGEKSTQKNSQNDDLYDLMLNLLCYKCYINLHFPFFLLCIIIIASPHTNHNQDDFS